MLPEIVQIGFARQIHHPPGRELRGRFRLGVPTLRLRLRQRRVRIDLRHQPGTQPIRRVERRHRHRRGPRRDVHHPAALIPGLLEPHVLLPSPLARIHLARRDHPLIPALLLLPPALQRLIDLILRHGEDRPILHRRPHRLARRRVGARLLRVLGLVLIHHQGLLAEIQSGHLSSRVEESTAEWQTVPDHLRDLLRAHFPDHLCRPPRRLRRPTPPRAPGLGPPPPPPPQPPPKH